MRINDKDFFILLFGLFLIASQLFHFSLSPFRWESLVVVFLFLLITRSLIEGDRFFPYLLMAVIGLALSTFLSPYSLLIFYIIALILYRKTNLL